MINFSGWAVGGVLVGLLASVWSYVKVALLSMRSLVVGKFEIESVYNQLQEHTLDLLVQRGKIAPRDRAYGGWPTYFPGKGDAFHVVEFVFGGKRTKNTPRLVWLGWVPLVITAVSRTSEKTGQPSESSNSDFSSTHPSLRVSYIRGTFDPDAFLADACRSYREFYQNRTAQILSSNRYEVISIPQTDLYVPNSSTIFGGRSLSVRTVFMDEELRGPASTSNSGIVLSQDALSILREARQWIRSEEWYRSKQIPWKRGWLLYGPPGTGKTSLASEVARGLGIPILVFKLNRISESEIAVCWSRISAEAPCVVLIEDIDSVFHGRTCIREEILRKNRRIFSNPDSPPSAADSEPVSFGTFINTLDGALQTDRYLLFVTANDITKVDSALGGPGEDGRMFARPGRIDRIVQLSYMDNVSKEILARRVLSDLPGELETVLADIDRRPDHLETPAQFRERCVQVALDSFWRKKDG